MARRQKIGKNMVLSLYPEALTKTYCVPPVHFNRVPYVRETVAGQPVLVLQPIPGTGGDEPSQPLESSNQTSLDPSVSDVPGHTTTASSCSASAGRASSGHIALTSSDSCAVTSPRSCANDATLIDATNQNTVTLDGETFTGGDVASCPVAGSCHAAASSTSAPIHHIAEQKAVTLSAIVVTCNTTLPHAAMTAATTTAIASSQADLTHSPTLSLTATMNITASSHADVIKFDNPTVSHTASAINNSSNRADVENGSKMSCTAITTTVSSPTDVSTNPTVSHSSKTSNTAAKHTTSTNDAIADQTLTLIKTKGSYTVVTSAATVDQNISNVFTLASARITTSASSCGLVSMSMSSTLTLTNSTNTKSSCVVPLTDTAVISSQSAPDDKTNTPELSKPAASAISRQVKKQHQNIKTDTRDAKNPQKSSRAGKGSPSAKKSSSSSDTVSQSRSQYSLWTKVAPQQVCSKPNPVQSNDVQEDFAQNHVLVNLLELGTHHNEAMFILSQFSFDDYLKRCARAADDKKTKRPADLEQQYRRGDFDILIIHRLYGILVGELKSVGWDQNIIRSCQSEADADADVAKRIERAIKQLDKSEVVLKYVLQDVAPSLRLKKTLFLPYVSAVQLQRVLAADPELERKARQSLGASTEDEITQLCCCSDHLNDPSAFWHVTDDVLSRLSTWWRLVFTFSVDPVLNDDLYLEIIGMFVGPASSVSIHCVVPPRVEVRTEGEAVSELGRRLARLVLTLQQLDLMNRAPPRVCITGPPGVGKTVMLVLIGLKWLLEGHNVHVISTRPASLAASHVMYYQLEMTLQSYPPASVQHGTVHFHHFDFYKEADVDKALNDLSVAARGGTLHILMEEAVFSDGNSVLGPRYRKLIDELQSRVPSLCFWVARVRHDNIPDTLRTETLTTPLRSAPAVLREVAPGVERYNVHNYSNKLGIAAPSDGPRVVRLMHDGDGHDGDWPHQCRQCGREVAGVLTGRLCVGARRKPKTSAKSPEALHFSDVFVLTRNADLHDDVIGDAHTMTSPASGLVLGLRDADIPVCMLEEKPRRDAASWERDVMETAVAAHDRVTVAHWRPVLGLERKVVVWLKGKDEKDDKKRTRGEAEDWDRVWVVSRCTTQLVVVDVPST